MKLVVFAILMAVAPIGTYFGSLHYVWSGLSTRPIDGSWLTVVGSSTKAAISAVVAANIVLVGYVWVAFAEDAQTGNVPPPRTGVPGVREGKKEK